MPGSVPSPRLHSTHSHTPVQSGGADGQARVCGAETGLMHPGAFPLAALSQLKTHPHTFPPLR